MDWGLSLIVTIISAAGDVGGIEELERTSKP
jgi:hypothetical protein